jgi:hypothetical protein
MTFSSTYHADSDADDEYERSVLVSPRLAEDSETSPIDDSEAASAENTPTFAKAANARSSSPPGSLITDWSAERCADFVAGLGFKQYRDTFIGNFRESEPPW